LLLSTKGFSLLDCKGKDCFLNWILENKENEIECRDRLCFIKKDLQGIHKKQYKDLIKKYGESNHPGFAYYSETKIG
jgi:hypothetical protein